MYELERGIQSFLQKKYLFCFSGNLLNLLSNFLPFGDIGSSEYGLLLRGDVCGAPRPCIEWGPPLIPGGQGKHGRVGRPGIIPPPWFGNPGGSLLPKPGGKPHPLDAAAAAAAAIEGGKPAALAAWRNGKGRCGRGWGKLPAPPGAPGPPRWAAEMLRVFMNIDLMIILSYPVITVSKILRYKFLLESYLCSGEDVQIGQLQH